ncbi:MAG: glutamate 5-kinase [Flavobacteriales bacterium]|jgi:glutamate 5-kinase
MSKRQLVKQSRRWVIKIGSALLTDDGRGVDVVAITDWVRQIAMLHARGWEIVLVSSGAIAAGMLRLGWTKRPTSVHELQAAAAVGQSRLIQLYEREFQKYNLNTAQVLLDHDDLSNRQRYLNARSTIRTLSKLNVITIVNENDTVVTDEIRFGDNDTLGALVANLIEADTLCILTDQNAMYDSDPRSNDKARPILERSAIDSSLDAMAGSGGGALGSGGMLSKLRASRLAARSGANTIIVGGSTYDAITRVANGEAIGTLLYATEQPIAARKRWLAGQLQSRGVLELDDGAVRVLREHGKSLLPVGVKSIAGYFLRGELVVCRDSSGKEVARGLINYSSDDCRKIAGSSSDLIESLIGYKDFDELIHRDNLILS